MFTFVDYLKTRVALLPFSKMIKRERERERERERVGNVILSVSMLDV
jgi:hypothetical protein